MKYVAGLSARAFSHDSLNIFQCFIFPTSRAKISRLAAPQNCFLAALLHDSKFVRRL
jgi:hypothetical protein